MLTDEQRRHIVKQHLDNIYGISSKDYQRRVWIGGQGPECDSFDEAVNHFFGDIDSVLEEYKDFWISDKECEVLKKFYNEFEAFCRDPNIECELPQLFIDIPEWTKITLVAKEVLETFGYQKS